MKILAKQWGRIGAGLLLIGLVAGCASDKVMVVAKPPVNAQKLGRVEGRAMGGNFLWLFPIRENSRTARAYNSALAKAPGATALTNVTLQENWYWYLFGTFRSVTISGEAVK